MEILEIEKGSVLPSPRVVYAYPYESMEVGGLRCQGLVRSDELNSARVLRILVCFLTYRNSAKIKY